MKERALSQIDQERFSQILAKYGTVGTGSERREKYLDLDYWLTVNVRRVEALGLHHGPPRRVLDLGCGCGYFAFLCRLAGHEAIGLDRPERDTLFTDMRALLAVPTAEHSISAFQPLPELGPFDVVTAHMVTFNRHRTPSPWGVAEWEWLLDLLRAPVVSLEMNREPDGTLYPPGVRELFLERGGRVDGHKVLIDRS